MTLLRVAADRDTGLRLRPRAVATALVVVFTSTMLWFTLQSFMWLDDYELQGLAYQAPWLDPGYLAQPWGGHFMPAGFALAQVLAKLTPFTFAPMAVLITVGMAAFATASARLMLYIFNGRWVALVPLTLLLISGAIWDSATWWIAALNAVPLLVAIPVATLLHLRWLKDNRFRDALLAWATVLLACLFFEKALGLAAFLGLLTLALRGRWGHRRRRWHIALLLALYTLTVGGFALAYVVTTTGTAAQLPGPETLASFLRVGLLTFPALTLGGPWAWAGTLAATPLLLAIAAMNLLLALAIWQSVRHRRAAILWLGLLAYVIALITVVASGRSLWGVQVIAQPRYFSEAVVYAIVIASVAAAYLSPRGSAPDAAGAIRRVPPMVWAVVMMQVVVAALATTLPALSRSVLSNPSRVYVVGAIDSLEEDSDPILNGLVPGDVMWPLVQPRNQLRFFFSPLFAPERFPDSADDLRIINPFGAIRPGEVMDDRSEPPDESCPWVLRDSQTVIPLPTSFPKYWHTIRFTYLSGGPTTLEVGFASGTPATVSISPGLNEAFAFVEGSGDMLAFARVPDGVGVCVSEIQVGFTAEKLP